MGMRYALYSFICLTLIAIDQLSKWAVTEIILRSSSLSFIDWLAAAPERLGFTHIQVTPFFNLVMVWNQGISFGIMSGDSSFGPIILTILSLIISTIFVVWLTRAKDKSQIVGILFIISGALGNVIDRVRFGAVIDFLDVHALGYHWPSFNVADSLICVGVALLMIHAMFFEKTLQDQPPNTVE